VTRHPRLAWLTFWVVSVLGLAAGVVTALAFGDRASAGLVLLIGVIVVGIGAAFLVSILAPHPGYGGERGSYTAGGGFGFGGHRGGGSGRRD